MGTKSGVRTGGKEIDDHRAGYGAAPYTKIADTHGGGFVKRDTEVV